MYQKVTFVPVCGVQVSAAKRLENQLEDKN